jgi:hypothetical protein
MNNQEPFDFASFQEEAPVSRDFQSSTKEQWICNPRVTPI